MKRKIFTLQDHIKESLKDPTFKKAWVESETGYQISRTLIAARIKDKISQVELAQKAHTTQAVISRLENMTANPSVGLLQKIAKALNVTLKIQFQ